MIVAWIVGVLACLFMWAIAIPCSALVFHFGFMGELKRPDAWKSFAIFSGIISLGILLVAVGASTLIFLALTGVIY